MRVEVVEEGERAHVVRDVFQRVFGEIQDLKRSGMGMGGSRLGTWGWRG